MPHDEGRPAGRPTPITRLPIVAGWQVTTRGARVFIAEVENAPPPGMSWLEAMELAEVILRGALDAKLWLIAQRKADL